MEFRSMTRSLLGAAALAVVALGAGDAFAKAAKAAGPREPTQAEMRAAVLEITQFRMSKAGMRVWIEHFEKVGCEKAQGAIGYNCDYFVRFGGDGFDLVNGFMGRDVVQQASGRFVLRNGKWTILQTR